MIAAMACENVMSPAPTKPMSVRIAAVEDWTSAVKTAPESSADRRRRAFGRAAGRRRVLQTLGEVVDPEQRQAQSTQDGHGGGGVQNVALYRLASTAACRARGAEIRLPSPRAEEQQACEGNRGQM
jgi:hypothetical protein